MALARRRALLRADVPAVVRHGRASPGHPRSFPPRARTWMPGTRPGMTVMGRCVAYAVVGIGTARMKRRSSNVRHGLGETTKLASRRRPAVVRHGRACPGHPRALA